MKNIVTATIEFSFKGETFTPGITIELDKHLKANGSLLDNLYSIIATENNIGLYSYEYEMMQAETIKFQHVEGFVENYIVAGILDIKCFEAAWHENHALSKLLDIAERHMNINDFEQHTELKQALLAAYQLGKQDT